jgi:zinc protease
MAGAYDMTRYGPRPRPALAALLLALPLLVAPTARAAGPTKVVTVEGITEYRLDNGGRALLFPDSSTSKVTVNMTVLVGSRHEGYGETGMAHLLEHMLFKGTPTHRNVPKALNDRGARFNGTTSYDRTIYFETLNATDANLEFAIQLEADRLVNSYVKREDLASEMTVVRNEFEQGENSPQNVLSQRMMALAYEWHNYGKSTIGNRSDIERVPIDKLQAFYRKYYQPDNVVVIVAGNFRPEKALALLTKYFGPLKRPDRQLDQTYTEEPAQDGERVVTLRRVGTVGVVGAVYHVPAAAHEDFAAVEVLASVLDTEPSGKLYQGLVVPKKASSVGAGAYGLHDPGVLEVVAQVDKGQAPEAVRDAMLSVLDRVQSEAITEAEVERARVKFKKGRALLMADSNRVGVTLSEWASKGDWRLFFLHRDRVAKVTPADVSRVARKYLVRTNRTVGLFLPTQQAERAAIPATPDLGTLLKDYKGGQAVALGESFDPTVENIEKRVRRSTLSGGVKVALLPRKTRGEVVTATLTLRYGNADSLKGQTTAAEFLGDLMLRGTKKHTRQQLQDKLDSLGARLRSGQDRPGELSFHLTCKRESFPEVLRLLGEVLREPTFPAEELDVLKREARDELDKGRTEPTALASRALQRKLAPFPKDSVRYVPTIEEELGRVEALTLDQLRKLYAGQLGGQHGEFVAVGDFDADATVKLMDEALKGWKAGVEYRRVERPAPTGVKGERQVIETPDKANAFYIAALALPLKDTDADNAALVVGDFLFGGGSLSSRLATRVRQKEGLSYGVRSQYSARALDRSASFLMYAICNPTNMDKVDRAMLEELEKVRKEGVNAAELAEAKKAYLAGLKVERGSDARLVSLLQSALEAGRTLAYYTDLTNQVEALTPEAVTAALRKHIDPANLVIIRAGDFKKK